MNLTKSQIFAMCLIMFLTILSAEYKKYSDEKVLEFKIRQEYENRL